MDNMNRVEFLAGKRTSPTIITTKSALVPTQPPIYWAMAIPSWE